MVTANSILMIRNIIEILLIEFLTSISAHRNRTNSQAYRKHFATQCTGVHSTNPNKSWNLTRSFEHETEFSGSWYYRGPMGKYSHRAVKQQRGRCCTLSKTVTFYSIATHALPHTVFLVSLRSPRFIFFIAPPTYCVLRSTSYVLRFTIYILQYDSI